MKKVSIQPSFILLFIIMIALGYPGQFFIMYASVTLHELAHIVAALYFKLNFKKIIIKPLGETAVIDSTNVRFYKRFIIVVAGPAASAVMAAAAYIFVPQAEFFITVNIIICLFNLLPICPLDGGRLFYMILSLKTGSLTASKVMSKIAFHASLCLILAGLIQVILYPYNISLYCIGVYLYKENKKEHLNMVFEFYKSFTLRNENGIFSIKYYCVDRSSSIKELVDKLCFDQYHIFYISDKGCLISSLTQYQLIDYIFKKGLSGNVLDIAEASHSVTS